MRGIRFLVAASLAFTVSASADASLLAKFYFFLRGSTVAPLPPKEKLPGQETRAFKLQRAHADDLLVPLQHYLNGVSKIGGSVQIRSSDNALIATDYPENLLRLGALIPDLDQPYENENAQARQMLVTQNLMKAIRKHPDSTVTTRGSDQATSAPRQNNVSQSPSVEAYAVSSQHNVHSHDADEMAPLPVRRGMNNLTLSQFELVGWMQDTDGYMVVLSNQGQRFLYRHGRLRNGYSPRATPLEGIEGAIQDNQLILNNGRDHITLKMLKWHAL